VYEYGNLAINGAGLAVQWELRAASTQEIFSSGSAAHEVAPAAGTLSSRICCALETWFVEFNEEHFAVQEWRANES
jgi:hypothetical protein